MQETVLKELEQSYNESRETRGTFSVSVYSDSPYSMPCSDRRRLVSSQPKPPCS